LFNIKKSAYGEFGNVWLSDDELMQLKNSHPDWEQWLNRLSLGKEMKGYVYHNDYAAILSWIRKQEDEERDQAYQELLDELL
jgi:diadenosine tetraphosphatase ApaH/serine/threonine PP2A family protein phosphatase